MFQTEKLPPELCAVNCLIDCVNQLVDKNFQEKFAKFRRNPYIINMKHISIEDLVYLAISYRATNVSAIAREMGTSRQNLHQKIKRNTLSKDELCKIGKILGAKYVSYYSFPGGVIIGDAARRT